MTKDTKITIIVVSLNTKKKFEKTIKSINNQTKKIFELIVVDGESSDGTIDIIKKYNSIINKKIVEKDRGIYDAMNKGAKIASGQWIIFLNSGDIFYKNNSIEILSKFLDRDVDVVFSDTLVENEGLYYIIKSNYFSKRTSKIPFCHQSSLVRTKLIQKEQFLTNFKLSSDFDFYLKIYLKNNIFAKCESIISTVESSGVSDKNRFLVFYENFLILKKNKFLKLNILFLIFDFIYLMFSSMVKFLITKNMKYRILNIKYLFLNKLIKNQKK